jgi:hypothetical protein
MEDMLRVRAEVAAVKIPEDLARADGWRLVGTVAGMRGLSPLEQE